MIHDHIDQADAYVSVLPGLDRALQFLRTQPLAEMDTGKHDIDGDAMFVIIDRYTPWPDDVQIWESHDRYADVQFIIAGQERMGVIPRSRPTAVKTPHDPEQDKTFYEPATPQDAPLWLAMHPGHLAVFLPHDIHAPNLRLNGITDPVTKAVVKVRVA